MGEDVKKDNDLSEPILSTLRGSSDGRTMEIKELRKLVLLSRQLDLMDKSHKKLFKKCIKELESNSKLSLKEDGTVKLSKSESKKKNKKTNKRQRDDTPTTKTTTAPDITSSPSQSSAKKTKTTSITTTNPDNITRLFIGNLPFAVDDNLLRDHFSPATVTHIKWITDKETGRFYGSAFVEMATPEDAATAVSQSGEKLLGRPLKVNYAPARQGDVWPPASHTVTGGSAGAGAAAGEGQSSSSKTKKSLGERPEGCVKLFIGNLSYDIDDDGIYKFFANVDAEVKAVRWLHHKESGDFKGCGFVEFWNGEACEKAAALNGKTLLGRPIRIDWTD